MGVSDVIGGFQARRVFLPSSGIESWTVIGPDLRPVAEVDQYLAWLTSVERSPNTVDAYARDLRLFWTFLAEIDTRWDAVDVATLGEFAGWARRPAANVVVLHEQAARRSAKTVNRMLTSVVGFYEFHPARWPVPSLRHLGAVDHRAARQSDQPVVARLRDELAVAHGRARELETAHRTGRAATSPGTDSPGLPPLRCL